MREHTKERELRLTALSDLLPESAREIDGARETYMIDARCETEACQERFFYHLAEGVSLAIPLRRPDHTLLWEWLAAEDLDPYAKRASGGDVRRDEAASAREWCAPTDDDVKWKLLARFVSAYTRFPNKKARAGELRRRMIDLCLSAERGRKRSLFSLLADRRATAWGATDDEDSEDEYPLPDDPLVRRLALGEVTPGGWNLFDVVAERVGRGERERESAESDGPVPETAG